MYSSLSGSLLTCGHLESKLSRFFGPQSIVDSSMPSTMLARLWSTQRKDSTPMMPRLLLIATLFNGFFMGFDIVYAGMITGEVKFVDNLAKPLPIKLTKDQDYCGETLPNETYLIGANGGLKNVVLFIESPPSGKPADPQKENFLYNDGCRYAPRVLAFQKGERLRVKSHDP